MNRTYSEMVMDECPTARHMYPHTAIYKVIFPIENSVGGNIVLDLILPQIVLDKNSHTRITIYYEPPGNFESMDTIIQGYTKLQEISQKLKERGYDLELVRQHHNKWVYDASINTRNKDEIVPILRAITSLGDLLEDPNF